MSLWLASNSCGSWLGNPQDFEDNEGKKTQAETSKTLDLVASVDNSNNGLLPVKDRFGEASSISSMDKISLTITSLSLVNDGQSASYTWNQAIDLKSQSQITLGSQNLDTSSLSSINIGYELQLEGAIGTQALKLDIQVSDQSVSGTSITLSDKSRFIVSFNAERWFNFSGEGLDLSSLASQTLDFSNNASIEATAIKAIIEANIAGSLRYGLDQDGDGILSDTETDQTLETKVPSTPTPEPTTDPNTDDDDGADDDDT
ncbi:hypothetical protein [Pseudobacteriovorax antillogorgiicola]|nr:hypothetical protein [Pseudobacteriovorax antillogorgiicola]